MDTDSECTSSSTCMCEALCKNQNDAGHGTCDCGSPYFPVWPTVFGIIGAILIFIFWHHQIAKLCRKYKYNGTLHPHMRDEPPPPPPRENSAEHPRETAWDAPPPYDALTKTGPHPLPSGISIIHTDNPPSYNDVIKMDREAHKVTASNSQEAEGPEERGKRKNSTKMDLDVEQGGQWALKM
ncbi:uncharacterized protein LOC125044707 [Penaeus chinensis]|uniref:uncharacterized protein LOC125044707 n=1 Tax=Penaeus chinensis TaxID=139456 RepID=UPI001FB6EDC9|nr:uncharacterized protein LOC125044707 [Penaeus chinensis]